MIIRNTIAAHAARSGLAIVLIFLLASVAAKQGLTASLQPIQDFGPNPGELNMHVYVPDGHKPNSAIVVALHGCTLNASNFDDETGLTALADEFKLVLLFPEQREANNDKRCFNWFQVNDSRKGKGESGSIRNMIQYTLDAYQADASKIFVLGLSAGGSMTAVLLANYPDLFQGGAIIAGTPYECNNPTLLTGFLWWWLKVWWGDAAAAIYACGLLGYAPTQRSANDWGDYVRASAGFPQDRWPKVSLWQGSKDETVDPANQKELMKQWTNVHGIDQIVDKTNARNNIMHHVYQDASGSPRLETYKITGFGHAIPIDPGSGPGQCGVAGDYIKDGGICSSLRILKFWSLAP